MSKLSRKLLALAPVALLAVTGCASPFRANVSRFQALPVPQGQTFTVEARDPANRGGLEFGQYANLVSRELERVGYRQADGSTANLRVFLDYNVAPGRERIVSRPDAFGAWGPGWGPGAGFYRPWYGRRGRAGFLYGWNDPFLWGGGWGGQQIDSYTIYESQLRMEIERAGSGERVFEGTAQAISRSADLPYLVPNLVEAMFTGFPGNSGETVRISVPPPERRR